MQARVAAEKKLEEERSSDAQQRGFLHTILDTKMRSLLADLSAAAASSQPVRLTTLPPRPPFVSIPCAKLS